MSKKPSDETQLAVMQNDITYIKAEVADIKTILTENYVTRAEFEPIRKIVYGLVTIILTVVVGSLVTLIIKK